MTRRLTSFRRGLENLAARHRLILIGGKGGVGKTTMAALAAIALSEKHAVVLFTTDPASNLSDLFGESAPRSSLRIEQLDAEALYASFLEENLVAFLEIGDRGTYLERDELRRFLELSLPGVDEVMAWMRIGELAEEKEDALVVVDTAPTGHTVRMLHSGAHFQRLSEALDAMQEKHRAIVRQLARRRTRDQIDEYLERFSATWERRQEMFRKAAFIPVFLAEPLIVEQTKRLIDEVRAEGMKLPLAILNRSSAGCGCARCKRGSAADAEAEKALAGIEVLPAPRSCTPLDSVDRLRSYLDGGDPSPSGAASAQSMPHAIPGRPLAIRSRLLFLAGKGGVGKTSSAASIALQVADRHPDRQHVVISVDPAHSLPRLFEAEPPPDNLRVEAIDTRAKWARLRESIGERISEAVDALTPKGFSLQYDRESAEKLIEMAPPGADELFAIARISDLLGDSSIDQIVVDTAPTGHFLRLLELPETAGEWVREFMRILLRYRDVMPSRELGAELVRASKALHTVSDALRSEDCDVVLVTRPERMVVAETLRLREELRRRGIRTGGVISNYMTPDSACRCDALMRQYEAEAIAPLAGEAIVVARRDTPPVALAELRSLVPLEISR